MMLKIEADTGKLDAKLKQADDGVRKLEASVKVGDRTMKAAVTTETQLAAALERFEGAAVKAATAQQRKAAASLAAQKSAALLKRLTDEERAAVKALTDAQEDAAKRGRIAVLAKETMRRAQGEAEENSHRRTQKRLAELNRLQDGQVTGWRRGASSALAFAGSLTGIGTAAAAAALLVRGLTAAHEHSMDVAKRSDQAARGLKEFIALQAEGEGGKQHVKDTVLKGAAAGVSAQEVGAIAQPIQSVVDSNGDGKLDEKEQAKFDEDFGAALKLRQMGVSAEDASTVITANRTKGIGGAKAADKLIAAADKSVGGPADFARAGSAINQFADTDTGLSVATALTAEGTPLEQLPTLVRGAAITLGSANDDSEFSKKFGLAGLSEAEKIAKLREEGAKRGKLDPKRAEELMQQYIEEDGMDVESARKKAGREARIDNFSRSFKSKAGGSLDEEKARAMGLLVRQGAMFESTREAVTGEGIEGLADKKVGALMADPLVGSAMRSDQAKALSEANAGYGVEAPGARDARARSIARGAEMQRYGGGMAVNEDGTEKSVFSTDVLEVIIGRAIAKINGMQGGTGGGFGIGALDSSGKSGQEHRDSELEKLRVALEKNTAATEANSASTKTSKPVGGAESNAKEKY